MKKLIPFLLFINFALIHYIIVAQKSPFQIKEIQNDGICSDYVVVDSNNKEVTLPPEVLQSLKCPVILHLDENLLYYCDSLTVGLYDLSTGKAQLLFDIFPEVEGISGPCLSPSHQKVAFVMVDQKRNNGFQDLCRILILTLNDHHKPVSVEHFDRPVHFVCGSSCFSIVGEEFKFTSENSFSYMRNQNIDVRPGEWDVIELSD